MLDVTSEGLTLGGAGMGGAGGPEYSFLLYVAKQGVVIVAETAGRHTLYKSIGGHTL